MASNSVLPAKVASSAAPRRIKVLRPPSFSPLRIVRDLAILLQYRDLLYTLSAHRIKVRYKQSALGIAWAIIQPLSLMLVYTLVFTVITRVPTASETPYPILIYPGLMLWTFFSTALTTATNALVSHNHLVTKIYFPREILPLTYVIAGLFDLIIASPVLLGLMIYYQVPLTLNALFAIPIIFIMAMFVMAAGLIFSAVQVRFRDVGMALPLLLQIWMFASPVAYPLSVIPERFRGIYMLNPMAGIVENFRRVLVEGSSPNFYELGASALAALILLPAAYIFFKHFEATLADII